MKITNKLSPELQELITVCQKNFHHTQKLQKQAHNKGVKPKNYAPDDKVWLNSKYIKTKQNPKLEIKIYRPFQVLHSVSKQAYKLELSKQWRIYNIFYIWLMKKDTTRKERIDKKVTKLKFEAGNSEKYKVVAI